MDNKMLMNNGHSLLNDNTQQTAKKEAFHLVETPTLATDVVLPFQRKRDRSLHGALAGSDSAYQEAMLGFVCGMFFGAVNPFLGNPFDSVKTRMQADTKFQQLGFHQTVRLIYQTEGWRGFYRGFWPHLVGSTAFRGAYFCAYSGTFAACERVPALHEPLPYTGGLRPSVLIGAMAAACARASVESPLDFIKVRFMVGKGAMQDVYKGSLSSGNTVIATSSGSNLQAAILSPFRSVAHLYNGFLPTLMRTIGFLGTFFVLADYSVRLLPDVVNMPVLGPFFKGGVCASCAWVVAFPFESVKSVIQADTSGKYRSMPNATWVVMRTLYRERGLVRGLYRGFGPEAGRTLLANGTSMIAYTYVQEWVRQELLRE